ncbi:MAG: adenosine kinase [Pseudomonadota bacterium]
MTAASYDVLGIGNAIFDILGTTTDDALEGAGMVKGSMRLVDDAEAKKADSLLMAATRISGGSAGNSVTGVAVLGGRAAFIGKVADDEFGDAYVEDMTRVGVTFRTPRLVGAAPTGTSVILVTPDGERTMNTSLGAANALTTDDIDEEMIAGSAITFLEGYLFDPEPAKAAFRRAAEIATKAWQKAALTLSDAFCVERHRADFMDWIGGGQVAIVFANEGEVTSLYEVSDFDDAAAKLGAAVETAVVTRGAAGARVIHRGESVDVPAVAAEVVDLTGAGDLFAGGYLLGAARGMSPAQSARLGAVAASEVITHLGARPQADLQALAKEHGISLG